LIVVPNVVGHSLTAYTKKHNRGINKEPRIKNYIDYIRMTDIGVEEIMFILLAVLMVVFRPRMMENSAFIFGSSKQGNARRVFDGASI
jgi:hypothetical protein